MDPLTLGLIILMLIALYFLMIRPANKRAKEQRETVNAIQPGSRVVLTSGLFGTVRHVGDKQMAIELAPECVITVLKGAVVRVAEADEEEFEYEDGPEELAPESEAALGGGATLAVPPEAETAQDPFYGAPDSSVASPYAPPSAFAVEDDPSVAPTIDDTLTQDPAADERRADEER